MRAAHKNKAKVYLVGAGPGQADLVTVRGADLLALADCIIYDKLANPALLSRVRRDAEIIHVPKRTGEGSFTQQQVNDLLIQKATEGLTVVRLKGGDPCIFGRAAEEAAVLADAGIDFEIVPGITAATAAAEYAGIMLTHRDYSSQVIFVTGREARDKEHSNIDWRLLAGFGGTIVFYMAMGNLDFIASQLMQNGMDGGTPAAVIADATLPTQKVVKAPLKLISQTCKTEQLEPPAVIVVGTAAKGDDRLNWFMNRPLFGKTIVVTRDEKGSAEFAAKISAKGGNPLEFATIRIQPMTETNELSAAVAEITSYDWIVFTSANGVAIFFDYLQTLGKDSRIFGPSRIAVIGSKTAAALRKYGITADFVPTVFTGTELGKQLLGFADLRGGKVLLLRSQLASAELGEMLKQAGAKVKSVSIYTIMPNETKSDRLIEKLNSKAIDWLTFTSSSSVNSFFEQIPAEVVNSSGAAVASIGPVTSQQLRDLGVKIDLESPEHTIDGLLAAIEQRQRQAQQRENRTV